VADQVHRHRTCLKPSGLDGLDGGDLHSLAFERLGACTLVVVRCLDFFALDSCSLVIIHLAGLVRGYWSGGGL
jgi:hypothetical protein